MYEIKRGGHADMKRIYPMMEYDFKDWERPSLVECQMALLKGAELLLLKDENGFECGYALMLRDRAHRYAQLGWLGVYPTVRGGGIGSEFLELIKARYAKYDCVFLEVTEYPELDKARRLVEFYRRHGDPITVEEVAELFNLQTAAKENVRWRRSEFSDILKTWKTSTAKTPAAPTADAEKYNDVSEILPQSATRFVYAKVPDDIRESINFAQSIPSQILEYEQRITYEKYRQYINRQSAISAAKTAPTASKNRKTKAPVANAGVRKIYPFDASTKKYVESEVFSGGEITRYAQFLTDVFYGGKPETSPTKDVRITVNIPDRPDTAFDFDFETTDGSVRAKIYFDSNLRKYLEELYREQKQTRAENAKQSTGKF